MGKIFNHFKLAMAVGLVSASLLYLRRKTTERNSILLYFNILAIFFIFWGKKSSISKPIHVDVIMALRKIKL